MNNLNINSLFNLTSAAVVVFGYLWASLANNRRMDDFRQSMDRRLDLMQDLLLAEIRSVDGRLGSEIRTSSSDLKGEIRSLSTRVDSVEKRLDRIERQLEHPLVRP